MKARFTIGVGLALGSALVLLGGCRTPTPKASLADQTASTAVTKSLHSAASNNTAGVPASLASPLMQEQRTHSFAKSGMAGGYASRSGGFAGGEMAKQAAVAASVPPAVDNARMQATYNPNMYVS